MKIILTKKEYLKLRPNHLKDVFIEAVRLAVESNGLKEHKYDSIDDALKKYDRDSENLLKSGDYPTLWPEPKETAVPDAEADNLN